MEKLLWKLAENAPLVLVIVGVVAFALGAAGGITVSTLNVPQIDEHGRWALMALGFAVVVVGAVLLWVANHNPGNVRALKANYGFRIEAPKTDHRVTSPLEVRGTFKRQPPAGLARILELVPSSPATYWPKPKLIITADTKSWSTRIHFGGKSGEKRVLYVALCGPDGEAMFDYYRRAGDKGLSLGLRSFPPM
jgi:hypothetical protein